VLSNSSSLSVHQLPYLSEKQLQQHIDEITKKLGSISVVDSEWEERLNSIKLLHAIAITPQNELSNLFFCTHPVFINALSSSPLRNALKKQFTDARSGMIKCVCDCLGSIAYHCGVFFYIYTYLFIYLKVVFEPLTDIYFDSLLKLLTSTNSIINDSGHQCVLTILKACSGKHAINCC
jgi:hypothetical protein